MNSERLRESADFIENEMTDVKMDWRKNKGNVFFMSGYFNSIRDNKGALCGTAACVAGSIYIMKKSHEAVVSEMYKHAGLNTHEFAEEYLELDWGQATSLFLPKTIVYKRETIGLRDIRKKHAIYVLRKMADMNDNKEPVTGTMIDVLWDEAFAGLGR